VLGLYIKLYNKWYMEVKDEVVWDVMNLEAIRA
jgi:hypothetical protein